MRTLLLGVLVAFVSGAMIEPAYADHRGRDDEMRGYPGHSSAFPSPLRHWVPPFGIESPQRQQPVFSAAYLHPAYPITLHGYFSHPRSYGFGVTIESRHGNFTFNVGR